jgi:hypothetical protein
MIPNLSALLYMLLGGRIELAAACLDDERNHALGCELRQTYDPEIAISSSQSFHLYK